MSLVASRRGCLFCLGILVLAVACRPNGAASPLALYPGSSTGHTARLQGTLEMDGACLYISGEGGERWLAAFPSLFTTWDAEDRSVRISGQVVRIGDTGGFIGGEVSGGASGVQWVQAPGSGCDSSKIWLVIGLFKS